MKKIILAAVFASVVSVPAFAADVITEAAPEPVVQDVVSAFSWTGGYAGIHAGGGWLDGDFRAGGASVNENFNGGLLGGFAGYNQQFDNFVVGIEGDVSYNWNENHYRVFGTPVDVGTDWAGSLRARLGYSFDRALLYGTAGWAATNGYVEAGGDDESRTFHGWTAGLGVDYAVTDNMFVRAEYRYTDFNDRNIQGINVDLDQQTATVGLGFKF